MRAKDELVCSWVDVMVSNGECETPASCTEDVEINQAEGSAVDNSVYGCSAVVVPVFAMFVSGFVLGTIEAFTAVDAIVEASTY